MCLSCLSAEASLHSWRLNRSRGGHSNTDPSAVAQLEQCKFIKENKRRNSGPAKILRGFKHAPCVMSWKKSMYYVHVNVQMSPLGVWLPTESAVSPSETCVGQLSAGALCRWTIIIWVSCCYNCSKHQPIFKTIKQAQTKKSYKSKYQMKSLQSYASAQD